MQNTSIAIIKKLKNAGFEAYWAGGCVRDMLLGVHPQDFDIVTSAKPEQIEQLLEKTIPIGKQFGVILVLENGHQFEVATFRSDSGYSDGRRPDAVIFTNATEDAKRRDFTINGMFYDPTTDQILDYVGGQIDLDAKIIRFIGDPEQRILEDHLRILRAIRFKNTLDFQYEPKTYEAICKHAPLLIEKVSNERIRDEITKMLLSQNAVQAFNDLEDTGVLQIILPELKKMKGVAQPLEYHREGDVWNHAMQALATLPADASLTLRWATLLHDVGKPETFSVKERIRFDHHDRASRDLAKKILTRLHYENKMIAEVCWLIEHHMMMGAFIEMPEGRRLHWFHHPWFNQLLRLFESDARGTTPQHLEMLYQVQDLYHATLKRHPKLPEPLLDGEAIMENFNLKPGRKIGYLLRIVREKQLEGILPDKKSALAWLASLIKK